MKMLTQIKNKKELKKMRIFQVGIELNKNDQEKFSCINLSFFRKFYRLPFALQPVEYRCSNLTIELVPKFRPDSY